MLIQVTGHGKQRDNRSRLPDPGRQLEASFHCLLVLDRATRLQEQQIVVHLPGRFVALTRIPDARSEDDCVEFGDALVFDQRSQISREFRKLAPVLACARLIEHLAQAVNVGLRSARPVGRQITFRAYKGRGSIGRCDQADVGQFRQAIHENDVRRFYIAMDQPMFVQMVQCCS